MEHGGYKVDGRYESDLTAVDPVTLEIKKRLHLACPNYAGTLATGGGLVFLALLDGNRHCLWRHYARAAVKDQCRLGLHSAADDIRGRGHGIYRDCIGSKSSIPEQTCSYAKEQRNATVLYAFGL